MNIKGSKKPSNIRLIISLAGILYVWFLPILANIGFTVKGSTSISEFISNPPATGAMAAISFMPLTLMWEYQDVIIEKDISDKSTRNILTISLSSYQLFYGIFLICTYGYVPIWLHTLSVVLFCLSFIIHSIILMYKLKTQNVTKMILFIGIFSFICLGFASDMSFWMFESIGFSSMLLFTPLEWLFYKEDAFLFSTMGTT
jgi:hypothetical protein